MDKFFTTIAGPKLTTHEQVKRIVISALLIALGVVLSRLLSYPTLSVSGNLSAMIGLGPLPIMLLAYLYGPLWGGVGALAWDMLGALLFPIGAFNPMFSVAAFIFGVICGAFFLYTKNREKCLASPLWVLLATAVGLFIYTGILNTTLLAIYYGKEAFVISWMGYFPARAIEAALEIPIFAMLLTYLLELLRRTKLMPTLN